MKIPNLLCLIYCVSVLCACTTFKKGEIRPSYVVLQPENLFLLNGTYRVDTTCGPFKVNGYLGSSFKGIDYKIHQRFGKKTHYLTLNVISPKVINVRLHTDSHTLKTYDIKGKIKDGYFLQKRKFYVIPAIYVNAWHSSQFRIGLLNSKNITTDYKVRDFGTVYIFTPYNDSGSKTGIVHVRIE